MKQLKRLMLVFFSLSVIVLLCAKCLNTEPKPAITRYTNADEKTCIKCHNTVVDSYVGNAHQNTSEAITRGFFIHGEDAKNKAFSFKDLTNVSIETRNGRKYQVAYRDGKETAVKRFDVAIGSGLKSYSYAYWENNKLFQLPLSYINGMNEWVNSPGFSIVTPNFSRSIRTRCLECHSSGVETVQINPGSFKEDTELKPSSIIYGINCQRCHGPAGDHVTFQLANPAEKQGKYIPLYNSLTRQQKIDACGVCHSGNDVKVLKSIFEFKPGDKLNDYYQRDPSVAPSQPDVHGNQLGLLKQSKCYLSSQMTCNSCHNVHESEHGSIAFYSQKCISCHKTPNHSNETLAKGLIKANCIDCHMPREASKLISFETATGSKPIPYLMRTHRIAIYKD
ncbi:hypothetical protein ACVWYG_001862 [Pedobacter sp. UYEF25]